MSLTTTAQRYQVLRQPVVDASVSTSDKYALLGVFDVTSSASFLSEDFRRQIARCLPAPDGSISAADRYNFAHSYRSEVSTGPTVDIFNLEWSLEPIWSANLLPSANAGVIAAVLQGAVSDFDGVHVGPPVAETTPDPGPVAGYGAYSSYYSSKYIRSGKKRRLLRMLQEMYEESEG